MQLLHYHIKFEISSISENCYRKGTPIFWLFGDFTSFKLSQRCYCSTHHKVTKKQVWMLTSSPWDMMLSWQHSYISTSYDDLQIH